MAREKKVVDASIIVKWFADEAGTKKALGLLDAHASGKILLVAPELAFLEALNALRYKGKSEKELLAANRDLWEVQLHIEKLNEFLLEKATQIALQHGLSIYDAIYVSLANMFGVPLITADEDLQKIPSVLLLDKI